MGDNSQPHIDRGNKPRPVPNPLGYITLPPPPPPPPFFQKSDTHEEGRREESQ